MEHTAWGRGSTEGPCRDPGVTGEEQEGGEANLAGQTALLGCEAPSSPVTTYLVTMTTDREAGGAGWQPLGGAGRGHGHGLAHRGTLWVRGGSCQDPWPV